jgi:hypothetical protein
MIEKEDTRIKDLKKKNEVEIFDENESTVIMVNKNLEYPLLKTINHLGTKKTYGYLPLLLRLTNVTRML